MAEVEKNGFISKVIGKKKRYGRTRRARARLPETYRTAVEAMQRYLMHFGPTDGDSAASMFDDLADLFEQAAADGTTIREIVGEDPVEFAEVFAQNYSEGGIRPCTEAADRRHRAHRKRRFRKRGGAPMTTQTLPAIHVQDLEKSYKELRVLRGWTLTWRGAASSPCSAPMAPARPRS